MSRVTQDTTRPNRAARKGLSPAMAGLSSPFRSPSPCRNRGPTTPDARCHATGLGSSPVARHYWGNHCYFLLLRVLRCFSSPRSPHGIAMMTVHRLPGCPIRKSAGQGLFAPNRGLSQLITSFIASVSQGIRHAPLFTFVTEMDNGDHARSALARTARSYFSCCLYYFTVLCVNMSKNDTQNGGKTPQGKVENNGFEPLTPCLQSRCSSQLS